jgi:hypothetical protein
MNICRIAVRCLAWPVRATTDRAKELDIAGQSSKILQPRHQLSAHTSAASGSACVPVALEQHIKLVSYGNSVILGTPVPQRCSNYHQILKVSP